MVDHDFDANATGIVARCGTVRRPVPHLAAAKPATGLGAPRLRRLL